MDGFSGYNQIQIAKDDQVKTAFVTDLGIYASRVMLFGLCNGAATMLHFNELSQWPSKINSVNLWRFSWMTSVSLALKRNTHNN